MIVNFKFDIGQMVYYVKHDINHEFTVAHSKIIGFQVRQSKYENVIEVDFRVDKNILIEYVSENKNEIQKIVDRKNSMK